MRWKWVVPGVCGFIVTLMIALSVALSTYNFNRLKPRISRVVKETTGREVTFGGDIGLEFGLTPAFAVNDVWFQNAPWGSRSQMATIKRLQVQVALLPLIFGRIELKRVVLVDPDILIESDGAGRSNLEFGADNKVVPGKAEQEGETQRIELPELVVKELRVTKGTVCYRDGRSGEMVAVSLDSFTAFAKDYKSPLKMELKGSYHNIPFKVKGSFGALAGLMSERHKPWPIALVAEALHTTLAVEGTLKDVWALRGMDLGFTLKGNELATVGEVFEKPLPLKGPLNVRGRVSDPAPRTYRISDLTVAAADSVLSGSIEASLSGNRLMVKAVLKSPKLDIRPILAGGSDSGDARSGPEYEKMFSNSPLPFETLKCFDADLKIQARQVLLPTLILSQVSAEANLKDGRLLVKPFKALVADGAVEVQLDLQSQDQMGMLATSIRIDHLDLGQMLKAIEGRDVLKGCVDISVDVWSHGNSIAGLIGGLNGKTAMVMGQGKIHNRYLDLLGADASSILFDLFGLSNQGRSDTPITCFVSGFSIKNGLAETTALVLETDRVSVIGDGKIDLRTERLNLDLNSIPKGGIGTSFLGKVTMSPGAMFKSFRITGTIAHPSLSIDTEQTVLTVGKMIGGTVLLGPIGLLAGFVTGSEVESPCSIAKRAAIQGVPMSVLAKQERKGVGLLQLPEEGLKELGKGIKKLFGQ